MSISGNPAQLGYPTNVGYQPYPSGQSLASAASGAASSSAPLFSSSLPSSAPRAATYQSAKSLPTSTSLTATGLSPAAAPLSSKPQGLLYPAGSLHNESDAPYQINAATTKKKSGANSVIWGSLGVYLSFLVFAFGGALLIPGLLKSRGRLAKFVQGTSDNDAEQLSRKQNAFEKGIAAHKLAKTPGLKHVEIPFTGGKMSTAESLTDRFVTTAKDVFYNRAWWKEAKAGDETCLVSYHAKGSFLAGKEIDNAHGVATIAWPKNRPLKSEELSAFKDTKSSDEQRLFAVSEQAGAHELQMIIRELDGKPNAVETFHQDYGIVMKDPTTELKNKKRTKKKDPLGTAYTWDQQFELGRETMGATRSNKLIRKLGQVVQRPIEVVRGGKKALKDPEEVGMRLVYMMQSSTMLNAVLAATSAMVALELISHSEKHDKASTGN